MKDSGQGRAEHLVARLLEAWVGFVHARPKRTMFLAVLLAVVSVVYTTRNLGFKTARDDLLRSNHKFLQNWDRYAAEFGGEADLLVLVEGTDRAAMIAALNDVANGLTQKPQYFTKVLHRIEIDKLRAKGLYQLPQADLTKIDERLLELKPLLAGGWSWFSLDNMLRATQFRLQGMARLSSFTRQPLDVDTRQTVEATTQMLRSLAAFLQAPTPASYRSPWLALFANKHENALAEVPNYIFSKDGHTAFLQVQPIRDPNSFTGLSQPVTVARHLAAEVQSRHPQVRIGLTGLPVLEDDEMQAANSAGTAGTISIEIGSILLLFIVTFRALRHPLYAMTAMLLACCWALGWITLTVGHLNILSVSFIVTLLGLGIDVGVLLVSRYEAGRQAGLSDRASSLEAVAAVGPGIITGAITTSLAFFSTMLADFLGLVELGWIAGSGVLICALGGITMVPVILALGHCRTLPSRRETLVGPDPVFKCVACYPVVALVLSVGLLVALAFQIPHIRFDYNLLNLQSKNLPSVQLEKRLVEGSGTSIWYALVMANSPAEAMAIHQTFTGLPTVGRVVELASMIPPLEQQQAKQPLIRKIHESLAKLPDNAELASVAPAKPETLADLVGQLVRLDLPRTGTDAELLQNLRAAATSVQEALNRTAVADRPRYVAAYQQHWLTDLADQLRQLASVSSPEFVTVADLPASLAERYVSPSGKWLVQIFAKASVWDLEPLQKFCDEVQQAHPDVMGKPISTLVGLTQMTAGYRQAALLATLVIFGAVWLDLRNVVDSLLAMLPLLVACVLMCGVMGLFHIDFNPANMIALPLILGIGVDHGVHVIHNYRHWSGPGAYLLPRSLSRALFLTTTTTVISFATLLLGDHWGLVSIGLTLMIGVSGCGLGAMVILPLLLHVRWQWKHAGQKVVAKTAEGIGEAFVPSNGYDDETLVPVHQAVRVERPPVTMRRRAA